MILQIFTEAAACLAHGTNHYYDIVATSVITGKDSGYLVTSYFLFGLFYFSIVF